MSTDITITNVSRSFNGHLVLDDVSLTVQDGELLALLGPSGSGKTTLLRLIAGLDQPDAGSITIGGREATQAHPAARGVGFVFQHYALFRHMNVFENIAFPLRIRKTRKADVNVKVTELLKLIQLETLAGRYPAQLSGGQRQRVALARALASAPRVLLLDEPFGALDAVVRRDLRRWLRQLHEEMHITTIFVTHDQEEAFDLADRIVIMNGGRLRQQGTPLAIYQQPADVFVHEFLGESNHLTGHAAGGIIFADSGFPIAEAGAPDGPVDIYIRPHHVQLRPRAGNGPGWVIDRISATGAQARISLGNGTDTLHASMTVEALLAVHLAEHMAVDIIFTGGTIFTHGDPAPLKLQALKPRLAV